MACPLSLTMTSALGVTPGNDDGPEPAGESRGANVLVEQFTSEQRLEIIRRSGLRHARHQNFATALAAGALDRLLSESGPAPRNLGLLSIGGPLNLSLNWEFVARAASAGTRFVNPLSFPHTLVSSTPTSLAAHVGAHAFAFATGHDHLAFFSVLGRAAQLIRFGFADGVLTLAVCDGGERVRRGLELSGEALPAADTAVCGLLQTAPAGSPQLLLLDVLQKPCGLDSVLSTANEATEVFWIRIPPSGCRESNFDTELVTHEAFGATGGVLCLEAARSMWKRGPTDRYAPFTVAVEAGLRTAGATLQWDAVG